jgi:hypothetical protein
MLSDIGSICSIIGLLLTIYVLVSVRRIEQGYLTQALAHECLSKLQASIKNVQSGVRRLREDAVRQEVHRCRVVLYQVLEFSENENETRAAIAEIERVLTLRQELLFDSMPVVIELVAGEIERLELRKTKWHWSRKDV